jgi:antitoxin (DNA-binding transcriptional repressor) of toxin-antitoxin stability system
MQVSMQEFKSHLSRYVGQAQSGQLIELTSHRKVVARIVGVPPTDSTGVSRLLAAGIATWQGGKPVGAAFRLQKHGTLVSALVMEDRG